jgi:hypothetical protein
MMWFQSDHQPNLFYPSINLEQRIPERHILRRFRNQVDFDFIDDEIRDRYGINGNVSVPPPRYFEDDVPSGSPQRARRAS